VIAREQVSEAEAIEWRRRGGDIVVCGGDRKANRRLAQAIESAVGLYIHQDPHDQLGPYALPHFQQLDRTHEGHCFHETDARKAAKNP
jgi:hypothetical protein